MYQLKRNPTTVTYCGAKIKSEAGPPPRLIIDSPKLPVTLDWRSYSLLGRCLGQLRRRCPGPNMLYSRAGRVLILEHYFSSKSSAALRAAFSNVYRDKDVQNKTTIHRLIVKCRHTKGFISYKRSSSDTEAEITAVPIASSAPAATTGHGCKKYCYRFRRLMHEGVHV
jgi:hypothetical protein